MTLVPTFLVPLFLISALGALWTLKVFSRFGAAVEQP